jgi:hypothetical protein
MSIENQKIENIKLNEILSLEYTACPELFTTLNELELFSTKKEKIVWMLSESDFSKFLVHAHVLTITPRYEGYYKIQYSDKENHLYKQKNHNYIHYLWYNSNDGKFAIQNISSWKAGQTDQGSIDILKTLNGLDADIDSNIRISERYYDRANTFRASGVSADIEVARQAQAWISEIKSIFKHK